MGNGNAADGTAPDQGWDGIPAVVFPDNPVLAATVRGPVVESFHRGAAIVLDAEGYPLLAWGDVERPVLARSALKPIQALALLETLPDASDLTDQRVALHTASQSGWPDAVDRVRAWLTDMGLDETALACGAGEGPLDPAAALAQAREGVCFGRAHHNCAGQHAGFLRLAQAMGLEPAGYERIDHGVQQAVLDRLGAMTDTDARLAPCGVEGCGIPSVALPLWAVALGMARLADPDRGDMPPVRRRAARRLCSAMAAHPTLVGGPGRGDTRVMQVTRGRVLAKEGAEGVIAALVPARGLGLAVKIDDGARRGAHAALGLILESLDLITTEERAALRDVFQPALTNAAGDTVGHVLSVCPEEPDDEPAESLDPWDEGWDEDDPPR